jgi:hypothetical protein
MAKVAPEQVFQGLVNRGLPAHVAEGIVMNLGDESGFDTSINETAPTVPGSRGGFGLAQWTGPRREALEQYAAQSGRATDDPDVQLDFLVDELHGPESGAFKAVMTTGTPGDAAAAFASKFLRPAKQHLDRRVADYTGGSSQDWPMGNALASQQPDYAGRVNALRAGLDGPKRPEVPELWQGLDPAMFMNRRG